MRRDIRISKEEVTGMKWWMKLILWIFAATLAIFLATLVITAAVVIKRFLL